MKNGQKSAYSAKSNKFRLNICTPENQQNEILSRDFLKNFYYLILYFIQLFSKLFA